MEELEGIGTSFPADTMPVDFWVGDDGNIYRFSIVFDGTTAADSTFESTEMIWEMFDYGAAIDIVAPPEEDVTDGSNLGTVFLTG